MWECPLCSCPIWRSSFTEFLKSTRVYRIKTLNMFYFLSRTIRCADPWLISRCATISFTVTWRFSFTMASTAAMPSGVTTESAWPGRVESVTELMPFMNFPVHFYTCCSDRHASPYWTFIRRWISMGFTLSLLKKTHNRTLFFFGACCNQDRHLYTSTAPSCRIPMSFCHLSATLQTISIIVGILQDNRAVVRNLNGPFPALVHPRPGQE